MWPSFFYLSLFCQKVKGLQKRLEIKPFCLVVSLFFRHVPPVCLTELPSRNRDEISESPLFSALFLLQKFKHSRGVDVELAGEFKSQLDAPRKPKKKKKLTSGLRI